MDTPLTPNMANTPSGSPMPPTSNLTFEMRIVRGLSIANIVIASLALLFWLAMAALYSFASSYLDDALVMSAVVLDLESQYEELYGYGYSYDTESLESIVQFGVIALIGIAIWFIIVSLIGLIAGILGVRNAGKPHKLGFVFGWSIAGAIASFFGGSFAWISTVLFVITAIYARRIQTTAYQGNIPVGGAVQGAQAMPQQPYGGYQQQAPTNNHPPYSYSASNNPYTQPLNQQQTYGQQPQSYEQQSQPYGQPYGQNYPQGYPNGQQPQQPAGNQADALSYNQEASGTENTSDGAAREPNNTRHF